ncbi:MAG: hypothetical protein R3250_03670 [Melioribacteraceae bacterium]|nr:hypothetical protein [Melioribacteraceae bacterium]
MQIIKYIDNFRKTVEKSFLLFSEELKYESQEKNSSKKWSPKETLGHLIDSAIINNTRFLSALEKEDLVFSKYPENKYVTIQNYVKRDWNELAALWKDLNLHIAELVINIPEEKLEKMTIAHNFDQICWKPVDENEKTNLIYLIKDYIGHMEHHLDQIINYKKG